MPKMKTHRGAAKRIKITGSGQVHQPQGQHQPPQDAQVEGGERGW